MTIIQRRLFLQGMVGLVAAPAIVKISSIMPVKSIDFTVLNEETMLALMRSFHILHVHRLRRMTSVGVWRSSV